ncbi:hypothetical protein [Caballeronia sp. J97]|uniref:hypothetical protein n=1 Tax=Caballeronia sp. J97 TaxID=2805429 RepID=UPI002AAF8A59|nr:hypothetical protein [Caballeronia sp. J97]
MARCRWSRSYGNALLQADIVTTYSVGRLALRQRAALLAGVLGTAPGAVPAAPFAITFALANLLLPLLGPLVVGLG